MDFDEVVRTTFTCREFTGESIPEKDLEKLLEQARFAPSGGNRQGWHVIAVRDPKLRQQFSKWIHPTFQLYLAQQQAGESPWNSIIPTRVTAEEAKRIDFSFPLLDSIETVPVILVVALDLSLVASFDKDHERVGVISGASIYPFVWNLLLAARNSGYGGALTTFLVAGESEVQEALNLPSHFSIAAMVPLGRPKKQLTKLKRKPVAEFATWDTLDGTPIGKLES
jgi:nitroreductase